MKRQIVGAREQIVQRDQFDPKVACHLFRDERIVGDDAHPERRGPAGDLLTDTPEPGEAQRLVPDLLAKKLLLIPFALLHGRVSGRQVAGKRQDQAEGQLSHADTVGTWGVHDDDAARAGLGDVDVVDTGAGACDHA